VGRGAVLFAVGLSHSRTAAEAKTRVPRIADRPTAGPLDEPEDFLGGGQAWVGEGDRLGRFGEDGRRLGAAVGLNGGRDGGGGLLNLVSRNYPDAQEMDHNADGARDMARAVSPPSDVPRADAK